MDYEIIEKLVLKAKEHDKNAKEDIINRFKPYIITISKSTHIHGYDFYDIQNECVKTVLSCIHSYNPENKKFVGYVLTSIRNTVKQLIKKTERRKNSEGIEALILDDNLDLILYSEEQSTLDFLCDKCDLMILREAIESLKHEDQELIRYIFFDKKTLRSYADFKKICYTTANKRKNLVLSKILSYINEVPA